MKLKHIASLAVLSMLGVNNTAQNLLIQDDASLSGAAQPGQVAQAVPGKPPHQSVLAQSLKRDPRRVVAYAAAGSGGERNRAAIVRSSETSPKINEQLEEDLAVMYRILEKAIGERSRDENVVRMGIPLLNLQASRARSLYLEDYGVVFTFPVDIPLLPDARAEKPGDVSEEITNEEWEETRNEVFGRKENRRWTKAGRPFNAAEVQQLKEAIIEALKNATNIRNLKPADFVTVVLRGKRFENMIWSGDSEPFRVEVEDSFFLRDDGPGESTMVIRVRKSDLDTLAKNNGDKTALKDKASVTTY